MKLVVGLVVGGVVGALVARRLRSAPPAVEAGAAVPEGPAAPVDPGPARVPVDVSAFSD